MKLLLSFFLLIFSMQSFAVQVEFIGPCSEEPLYSTNVSATSATDVGTLTINVLDQAKIPYLGVPQGFNQIFNTPIGMDALEILNDEEMLSYGWCFEVNGKNAEVYPNEIPLKKVKTIKWFYGYAHYVRGEWVSLCEKSYLRRSEFICGKN